MAKYTPQIDRGDDLAEILLVEDNPGDVRLIQEAFSKACTDVELHIATDGVEAIEELSRRRNGSDSLPNLVLLDLDLPRMHGIEVLDAVRSDPVLSHLPLLILTSSTESEDVVRCYTKSANAFLTKPDSPDDLVSLANAVKSFWIEHVKLPTAGE